MYRYIIGGTPRWSFCIHYCQTKQQQKAKRVHCVGTYYGVGVYRDLVEREREYRRHVVLWVQPHSVLLLLYVRVYNICVLSLFCASTIYIFSLFLLFVVILPK